MIAKILSTLKARGLAGVTNAVSRRLFHPRLECARRVTRAVGGRSGLEIGGPTALFSRDGLLPVYAALGRLANVNFSARTVWEGVVHEGPTFVYDSRRPPGMQYVMEASDLARFADGDFEVLLSSHTLEHVANPLDTLREWMRVLSARGILVMVLPHKEGTFDHRRPVTLLEHLVDDERRGTGEDDLTHLPEILALHDLTLDPQAGNPAAFAARSSRNLENRCLHHHVFDTELAIAMIDHAGLQILEAEAALAHHIFIIARKAAPGLRVDNAKFVGRDAAYRQTSPFAADRG